jgi:cell division protein FtsL
LQVRQRPSEDPGSLKPFFSVLIIIFSLLLIVFAKMEERRVGYSILKLTKEQRKVVDEKRNLDLKVAKLTRPEHVEKIAKNKFTLKKVQDRQIIHLSGSIMTGASK